MHYYHNLLYISYGNSEEQEGLKQSLSIASNNQAPLKVLIIVPDFPKEFAHQKKMCEERILRDFKNLIASTISALHLEAAQLDISLELLSGHAPAIQIIQQVLSEGYDLVIKEVEHHDQKNGFRAIDMELLSKCPSAVWLSRPLVHINQQLKIAVAIDPRNEERPAAHQLSKHMLKLASSLAAQYGCQLHVISCWDALFEEDLSSSVWVDISEEEISEYLLQLEKEHKTALEHTIAESEIPERYVLHYLKGKAEKRIPDFVREEEVDILVMGTVARTGISGLIIGNTAENIFQQLSCSLLALKPQGFISPVSNDSF